MTGTSFRFTLGELSCTVLNDGVIGGPPPSDAEPMFEGGAYMDVSCLLVEYAGRTLLIDTGCGSGFQDTAGKLSESLAAAGIDPAAIGTIAYTHGHPDHVGGTFDESGKPVFPNARQVALQREWDCWNTLPPGDEHYHMFDIARERLVPIPEQFDIVEENAEVFPGVRLLPAYGHSPGHAMVGLTSGGRRLLCIGDLIHSEQELVDPKLYAFLDNYPEAAEKLRTDGLAEIAASGILVYACHFPFPGLGRFVGEDGNLRWQPESPTRLSS